MKNGPASPIFPGISAPTSDFGALLDGRRAPIQMYELDLSVARSFTAGTAVQIKISGNAFFVDQAPDVGTAYVVFEGVPDNTGPKIRPAVYVQPGFPLKIPFANLWIANTAQAGKVLRIFYGVDIDFQAATSATVGINGTITANISPVPYSFAYKSTTPMAALTADTIFAAGTNTVGAILWRASIVSFNGANNRYAVIANTSVPGSLITGDVLVASSSNGSPGINPIQIDQPIYISPGKGLYVISEGLETIAYRSALYNV